ncbi:PLP-dependent transferase [Mycena venus]|uniref:PLP-dependent transferase n=1 Tax=Mycena venus TaxID=2733690 RepID=A0A8H7CI07_9AGAR|nr:PLP-dependent transferase [Mycena venus]
MASVTVGLVKSLPESFYTSYSIRHRKSAASPEPYFTAQAPLPEDGQAARDDIALTLSGAELTAALQYGPAGGMVPLVDWLYDLQRTVHGRERGGMDPWLDCEQNEADAGGRFSRAGQPIEQSSWFFTRYHTAETQFPPSECCLSISRYASCVNIDVMPPFLGGRTRPKTTPALAHPFLLPVPTLAASRSYRVGDITSPPMSARGTALAIISFVISPSPSASIGPCSDSPTLPRPPSPPMPPTGARTFIACTDCFTTKAIPTRRGAPSARSPAPRSSGAPRGREDAQAPLRRGGRGERGLTQEGIGSATDDNADAVAASPNPVPMERTLSTSSSRKGSRLHWRRSAAGAAGAAGGYPTHGAACRLSQGGHAPCRHSATSPSLSSSNTPPPPTPSPCPYSSSHLHPHSARSVPPHIIIIQKRVTPSCAQR